MYARLLGRELLILTLPPDARHLMPTTAMLRFRSRPRRRALCFVAVVGALLTRAARADDWPQFLGPLRNGVYAGNDLAPSWPAGGPKKLWSREVGEGFAGPAVAGDRLVLFHRLGDRETVECLHAETGEGIWSFDYPTAYVDDFGFDNGPRSVPTLAEGRVYTFGAEGTLDCLDLETGKKLWSVEIHKQFGVRKGYFGAACSPAVEGNRVLLNIGGRKGAGVGAFDKRTGAVVWTATDDEASYSSPIVATLGGERHALFFTRAGLVDADPADGTVRLQFAWRPPISASVNAATPLAIGDQVFLSTSYGRGAVLLNVKGNQAEPVWQSDDAMTNHYATCVYRDGYLYGFHGRQEYGPSLRCVELATGRVVWSQDRFGAGTLILAGDRLVVLREDGQLVLASASPQGYRELARARVLPATARAYPALSGGRLYARNANTLVAVDLRELKIK